MRSISVEVAYATPNKQQIIELSVNLGQTVEQAIIASDIANQFPEIDLLALSVGVFGKVCKLDKVVEQGDRIEIYRPLLQNPMEARRNRAVSSK